MNTPSVDPTPPARPSRRLLLSLAGVALFIAVGGMAGTALLRSVPEASAATPAAQPAATPEPAASMPTQAEGIAMVEKLAERLKTQPDDLEGWQMLARAYTMMGRTEDGVAAYRRVLALSPADAQAHADLGRAIANANGRRLNPESEGLLNKALAIDSGNVMAHALLGKVALDRGQRAVAKKHFEDALAHIDQEHPFAQQLRTAIQIASSAPALAASAAAH